MLLEFFMEQHNIQLSLLHTIQRHVKLSSRQSHVERGVVSNSGMDLLIMTTAESRESIERNDSIADFRKGYGLFLQEGRFAA